MKYLELIDKIRTNIFPLSHVYKFFGDEDAKLIKIQLHRFAQKKLIKQIKRGWYYFDEKKIDEHVLASLLYKPSYISLESALNYYGIIPDVSFETTLVSPTTTKKIKTSLGIFSYQKIKKELFFGFQTMKAQEDNFYLARKEKALLDFFYIRKIRSTKQLRLRLNRFDLRLYKKYLKSFPAWLPQLENI